MRKLTILFILCSPLLLLGQYDVVNGNFIIDNSLGIGTDAPEKDFHLNTNSSTDLLLTGEQAKAWYRVLGEDIQLVTGTYHSGTNNSAQFLGHPLAGSGILNLSGTDGARLLIGNRYARPLVFGTNDVEVMRIAADGNIGIGTDSPENDLHLATDGSTDILLTGEQAKVWHKVKDEDVELVTGTYHSGTNNSAQFLGHPLAGSGILNLSGTDGARLLIGNRYARPLVFGTNDVEVMRIAADGNIGIGTDSPENDLHLATDGSTDILLTGEQAKVWHKVKDEDIELVTGTYHSGTNNSAPFLGHPLAGSGILNLSGTDGARLLIGNRYARPLVFGTNDVEVMRIAADGNIGIGTDSPENDLHLATDGSTDILLTGEQAKVWHKVKDEDIQLVTGTYHSGTNNSAQFLGHSIAGSGIVNFSGNSGQRLLIGNRTATPLVFGTNDTEVMRITSDGKIGIGTSVACVDCKLDVNGGIRAEEITVELVDGTGPDFVFEEDYDLMPLEDVASYIDENNHLPEIPAAQEMEEQGLELREMNLKLLQKVEELTLYLIDQNQQNKAQELRIEQLEQELNEMKSNE